MGDIYIDLRAPSARTVAAASEALRFFEDMFLLEHEEDQFSLVVSLQNESERGVWAPHLSPDGSVYVALAGKIALEEREWEKAEQVPGEGGLACKAIFQRYESAGNKAFANLNGSYVVVVRDARRRALTIVTDGPGMFPCFIGRDAEGGTVVCSHADVLARAIGCDKRLDRVSLAEFLMTGKVTPPYTYYTDITALDSGSVHTFDLSGPRPRVCLSEKHFDIRYSLNGRADQQEFANELGSAFRQAVQKRVSPRFGSAAVTISGGMDSRVVLCSALQKMPVRAICFFDEQNFEYKIASRIARECKVELIPFKRDFDHYAHTAALGVKIYGGMGNILNNHFLGFRSALKELGVGNLLTGFYCDYLFKGLGLDRKSHRLTRLDQLGSFNQNWYRPCYWYDTHFTGKVKERLEKLFPQALRSDRSPEGMLEREKRRLFPLCYEPDHAETTVPQRVLPWDLPTVDVDLLKVYMCMPPAWKLNSSAYSKAVEVVCGRDIADIPNANTGARVGAQGFELVLHSYITGFRNRFDRRFRRGIAARGSWPNWEYYLHHSPAIRDLWLPPDEKSTELFREILGYNPLQRSPGSFPGDNGVEQFSRLLTLKLWLGLSR